MTYNTDRELFGEIIKAEKAVTTGQYPNGIVSTMNKKQSTEVNGYVISVADKRLHENTYTPEKIRLMELENSLTPQQRMRLGEYRSDIPVSMSYFITFAFLEFILAMLICNLFSQLFTFESFNPPIFLTGISIWVFVVGVSTFFRISGVIQFNQKWGNEKENKSKKVKKSKNAKLVVEVDDTELQNEIEAQLKELKQYCLDSTEERGQLEIVEAVESKNHLELKIPLNSTLYTLLKNQNIIK